MGDASIANPLKGREPLTIGIVSRKRSDWETFGWSMVIVWVCANVLSQAAYVGRFGKPYDTSTMLLSIGQWYWILIAIEVAVWIMLGTLLGYRFRRSRFIPRDVI